MPPSLTAAGRVATLTLDEPETRNAITGAESLNAVVSALETDPADISVLVITGAGPAFSAGGNIKDMAARQGLFAGSPEEIMEGYRSSIQRLTRALLETDLVTVAAVNGPAIGAGFDLALGCDLRLGSTSARFAHTFVDLGIIPGDGGAWLLPRVVGWQRAAELAFTARSVEAEEAREMGILLEVTGPPDLMTRAMELARLIASKPAHSIRLAKRLLRHAKSMDLPGFLEFSAALQAISHHTDAHHQAMAGLKRSQ
ncbi:MAG TPA: enoyl-CoA hydratase-related protein [Acidimicrobiia bacterium]|nr:enoyl-CoA hydratase-related protein [Acidimicrobiia bacterium]